MKPTKSKKYLDFVRNLPCSVTGFETTEYESVVYHHIKGYGLSGMRTKCSDYFVMPIKNDLHQMLHSQGVEWFETMYRSQIECVLKTLKKGIDEGKVDEEKLLMDVMAISNTDLRNRFLTLINR